MYYINGKSQTKVDRGKSEVYRGKWENSSEM